MDRRLIELCTAIAEAEPRHFKAAPLASGIAGDSMPPRLARLRSIGITCRAADGTVPHRHLPTDTPDAIDRASLERAHAFSLELVRRLDADLGRAAPTGDRSPRVSETSAGDPRRAALDPSPEVVERSNLTAYVRWLAAERGLDFGDDYDGHVAVVGGRARGLLGDDLGAASRSAPRPRTQRVLGDRTMPGAKWFEGAQAQLRREPARGQADDRLAIQHASELRELGSLTWGELRAEVARVAAALRRLGVEPGDRVVAYLPNIAEAVIAFLATASIGAIWSSCSPDFGASSVVDRFAQIEPKVLFCVDGYRYNGRDFDRRDVVAGLLAEMPTVEHAIVVPYLDPEPDLGPLRDAVLWDDALGSGPAEELDLRAGAVRPPALGPLLVRDHRPAEGDRPGTRRDPARAAQIAQPPRRRAGGRPHLLVHHHGLDDVELPRRRPAHRRLDRPLRRQPGSPRHGRALGPRGGRRGHLLRHVGQLRHRLHEGGGRTGRRARSERPALGRLHRLAAGARGLRLDLRARGRRHLAVLHLRRHGRLHRLRRRRPHPPGLRRRAAGPLAGRRDRGLGRGRQARSSARSASW